MSEALIYRRRALPDVSPMGTSTALCDVRAVVRIAKDDLDDHGRSLLVRYADVVLDPAHSLMRILTYLDLDADPERINQMLASAGAGLAGGLQGGRWVPRGIPFDCRTQDTVLLER